MISNNQKIHLKDFPEDKIVVFLESQFRANLIDTAIKLFTRKKLAEYLTIRKLDTISRWKKAKIRRSKNCTTPQGIPLDKLKILSNLLKIDLNQIERHVTAYKSKGKSLWIKNPKLPIEESPELFRIIAHLMGDGSANENNVNYFKNFNKSVYSEFVNDLKQVFGDVEVSLNKDNIVFPISIRHILAKFYNIEFGTFDAKVPDRLFDLPRGYTGAFTQGFFDDEGNVSTSCLRFYSFNKELINGVRRLLLQKFPDINPITGIKSRKKSTGFEYYFSINASGIGNFNKLIGCTHSFKKEMIDFYLRRKNKQWNHRSDGATKNLIIQSLSEKPKTINGLAKELNVSRETIRAHLFGYYNKRKKNSRGLVEEGLIKMRGIEKYNAIRYGH